MLGLEVPPVPGLIPFATPTMRPAHEVRQARRFRSRTYVFVVKRDDEGKHVGHDQRESRAHECHVYLGRSGVEPTAYHLRRDRIGVDYPRGCTDTSAGDGLRTHEEDV